MPTPSPTVPLASFPAPVFELFDNMERLVDNVMGRRTVHLTDGTDAAGIVFFQEFIHKDFLSSFRFPRSWKARGRRDLSHRIPSKFLLGIQKSTIICDWPG